MDHGILAAAIAFALPPHPGPKDSLDASWNGSRACGARDPNLHGLSQGFLKRTQKSAP